MSVRVVLMSDSHGLHRSVKVPDGDILIHCGDLTGRGTLAELKRANRPEVLRQPNWHILQAGNYGSSMFTISGYGAGIVVTKNPDFPRWVAAFEQYLGEQQALLAVLKAEMEAAP